VSLDKEGLKTTLLGAIENLIVATGHAMIGPSLGPITGKYVAELASRQRPSLDLALFSPDRFAS